MSTPQEAYAILGWRAQGHAPLEHPSSIADYLIALDVCIRKAKDAYAYEGEEAAMQQIRDLTAMAVQCIEDHKGKVPEDAVPW
jgi:hypothetical protein